jgi:hypothetical protein
MMRKYKTIPVEIEAVQWDGGNRNEIWKLCTLCYFNTDLHTGELQLMVQTPDGIMEAELNDYLIKDHRGQYFVCKPDEFKLKYEEVNKNQ